MIVLVGKTCSGKNTIQDALVKLGYKRAVTYTTRPKRENEIDGVNYHFISSFQFNLKNLKGEFIETTSYDVATGERWFYGTTKECFEDDNSVIILNPEGLKNLIKNHPELNITSFYIKCGKRELKKRLKLRGDSDDEARRRLKADKRDFKGINKIVNDYVVNNGDFDVDELVYYIDTTYKLTELQEIFPI